MLRILLATALVAPALCSAAGLSAPVTGSPLERPAVTTRQEPPGTVHYWYDGTQRRALIRDGSANLESEASTTLRTRAAKDDTAGPGAVPVFRDANSPAVRLSPQGGVIVTTKQPSTAAAVDRLLAPRGLAVSRQIDPEGTRWLVDTAPGIVSIEIANELHESGAFAGAQPNWWRERALK